MSANSPDVKLSGYNKFECRRTHKRVGGVCIFVNDMLTSKSRPDLHVSDTNFEQCMAEIIFKKHKLLVGFLYRAPNTDQSKFLSDYKKFIETLTNNSEYKIILGMDHNLDLLKSHIHKKTQQFLNMNLGLVLFPVITKLTRITHTSATLIDNIFLDSRLTGQTVNKILVDDISDHLPIVLILENLNPSKKRKMEVTSRDIRPKQIELLKKEFTSQLNTITLKGDTNEQFDLLYDIILRSIDTHCPIRVWSLSNNKFRKEPWLTAGIHIICNKQKKLYQTSISNNTKTSAVEKYKAYRNILKKLKRISELTTTKTNAKSINEMLENI